MTLKVIVADDEPGILTLISSIISEIPEVRVVGKASTAKDAFQQVIQTKADVIFSDIHFPDGTGIELAKKLISFGVNIEFIFVTVDPNFSLDAHKIYSYDYILKPIDEYRVVQTISRLKKQKETNNRKLESVDPHYFITVKKFNEILLIDQDSIIFFEKIKKKLIIHCLNDKHETTGTLEQFEKKLKSNFFRSHKSYIVNVNSIKKIVRFSKSTYQLYFHDTTKEAFLSRRKYPDLLEIISNVS